MTTTFVLISVSDRVDALNELLDSIRFRPAFKHYHVSLLFQDPDGVADRIRHRDKIANFFIVPEKLGCHGARVELLRRIRYDSYVNLDDDVELTEHTHYQPAIDKAMEPGTGFVLTNWARTRSLLDKKVRSMRHEFIRQALVYQGGGMCYRDEIADLIAYLLTLKGQ